MGKKMVFTKVTSITFATILSLSVIGCGGGSSSSSSKNDSEKKEPVTKEQPTKPTTSESTSTDCVKNSDNVIYLTEEICTYSSPAINNGAKIQYVCRDGKAVSSMGMSSESINLDGVKLTCKK